MGLMKIKMLVTALTCLGLSATQAYADSEASMEFTIEGTAEKVCIMPEPSLLSSDNITFDGGQTITIGKLISETDATLNTASVQLKFPDVMCNYPAKVSIKTGQGGLIRPDPGTAQPVSGSADFKDKIDYRIHGTWGTVQLPEFSTEGVPAGHSESIDAGGANKADLIVNLTVDGQAIPVLMGSYTDNVTVKVGLQP